MCSSDLGRADHVALLFTREFAAEVGMVRLYVHGAVPSDRQGQAASLPTNSNSTFTVLLECFRTFAALL